MTETITQRLEPDITIFAISGRLQLGNLLQAAESAIQDLIDGGVRKLVIDLTRLDAIDSSGIGVLITCAEQMEEVRGQVRIAGARGMVSRVFETIHVDRIIPLDTDLASACAAFSNHRT